LEEVVKMALLEEKREQLEKARLRSKEEREMRLFETVDAITEYIAEHPGRNLSEIARSMRWSVGKAQRVLNVAERDMGNIKSIYRAENGINKRYFYIVPWYNKMDWKNFEDNEATQLLVEKVARLQQQAYQKGIEIEITDPVLREKLGQLMRKS
jgi:hypothetical protein